MVVLLHALVLVLHKYLSLLVDKDVYRTDREVDKYKGSSSHSLTQLEDILTTYVMYNLDLGNRCCMNRSPAH